MRAHHVPRYPNTEPGADWLAILVQSGNRTRLFYPGTLLFQAGTQHKRRAMGNAGTISTVQLFIPFIIKVRPSTCREPCYISPHLVLNVHAEAMVVNMLTAAQQDILDAQMRSQSSAASLLVLQFVSVAFASSHMRVACRGFACYIGCSEAKSE